MNSFNFFLKRRNFFQTSKHFEYLDRKKTKSRGNLTNCQVLYPLTSFLLNYDSYILFLKWNFLFMKIINIINSPICNNFNLKRI